MKCSIFITLLMAMLLLPGVTYGVPADTTTLSEPSSLRSLAKKHLNSDDGAVIERFIQKMRRWNNLSGDTAPAGRVIVLPRFEEQTESTDNTAQFDFPGSATSRQTGSSGSSSGFNFGSIEQGDAPEPKSNWVKLYQNGDYTLNFTNRLFLNERASEQIDQLRFGSERRFESTATLGFESRVESVVLDLHLEGSNLTNEYQQEGFLGRNTILDRNYLHLDELSYQGELPGDYGQFLIGKKPLRRGVGNLYSPADHHNRLDATNPLDIRQQGVWRASYTRQYPQQSLGLHIMPLFEPSALPDPTSRWNVFGRPEQGNVFDTNTLRTIQTFKIDVPGKKPKDWNVLLTWNGTFQGYDLFLDFAHGPIHRPLGEISTNNTGADTTARLFYPDFDRATGGFSTGVYDWTVYGELFYRRPSDRPIDDTLLKGMAGLLRTYDADPIGFKRAIVNVEYARENIINRADTEAAPEVTTRDYRPGKHALFGALRLQGENLEWENGLRYNLQNRSSTVISRVRYKFNESYEITLQGEGLSGGQSSSITGEKWGNNDRISVSWTTFF